MCTSYLPTARRRCHSHPHYVGMAGHKTRPTRAQPMPRRHRLPARASTQTAPRTLDQQLQRLLAAERGRDADAGGERPPGAARRRLPRQRRTAGGQDAWRRPARCPAAAAPAHRLPARQHVGRPHGQPGDGHDLLEQALARPDPGAGSVGRPPAAAPTAADRSATGGRSPRGRDDEIGTVEAAEAQSMIATSNSSWRARGAGARCGARASLHRRHSPGHWPSELSLNIWSRSCRRELNGP